MTRGELITYLLGELARRVVRTHAISKNDIGDYVISAQVESMGFPLHYCVGWKGRRSKP